jgi:hypothetical protein
MAVSITLSLIVADPVMLIDPVTRALPVNGKAFNAKDAVVANEELIALDDDTANDAVPCNEPVNDVATMRLLVEIPLTEKKVDVEPP